MSDEPIPSLAEALTEIRRLRARVAELEAINAMVVGTVRSAVVGEMSDPVTYTHNVPPSAPPHDE